ncbi:hypothetical protein J7M23_07535 [Candidatus Sumerlaeota bacterium]|nr:hypothetical protein [Candidatus Sumerlaeota bacterium]
MWCRFTICIILFLLLCIGAGAQYTIINGHFEGNIAGWDGTPVDGRENGPFQGTAAYQAINSSNDTAYPSSGSVLFTADSGACSLSQQLGFNAEGQTLSVSADIAWDGSWTNLYFGFYEDNVWNRIEGASIEITPSLVPPDTDGTLDSFTRVCIKDVILTNTGNPVRVYFGTSCSPGWGGANVGTSIAVDNVVPYYDPIMPTEAKNWYLYY